MHNVRDHQSPISDVGVINDVDALKSMPCDNLDAASLGENRMMRGYRCGSDCVEAVQGRM